MADLSGWQLGNYRLLRLIGSGGFAEVYLGEHIYLNTIAAVKVLQTQLVSNEDRDAFCNEARTIAHLTHQHILRVLDFDVEHNIPFLVTEYAPHGTLRERHPKHVHVPLRHIINYVTQIACALQYAHDHRVVHRDVKPENILLGTDGTILLSDFGIAIIMQSTSARLPEKLLGTGAYMAPEQFRGMVSPASDQYALAIMTYEWLCGERPFQGSFADLYEQHLKIPAPSLRGKLSTVPLALEAVLLRALEKQPEARFSSISEFAHALAQTLYQTNKYAPLMQETMPTISHTPDALETLPSPGDASSVLTETRTSYVNPQQQETPPTQLETLPPTTPAAQFPTGVAQSTEPASTARPARSISSLLPTQPVPQKKHSRRVILGSILAVIGVGAASALAEPAIARYFQAAAPTAYTYHGHKETVWSVSWSPDSKRIASASADQTVQVWDALTGLHMLPFRGHTATVRAVAWSPSGNYLASGADDHTVYVWHPDSLVRYVTYRGHSKSITALAWSPDNQRIASASSDRTVQIWNVLPGKTSMLNTHAPITYTGHTASVTSVAWSSDSKYLASASDDTTVQVWHASDGKKLFTYGGHTGTVYALAWSPDSQLLASGSADMTVQVWHALSGVHISTYTGHTRAIRALAWSPEGQRIVSASEKVDPAAQTTPAPLVQIWDASTGKHLYFYKGHTNSVTNVAWSENSRYIASAGFDTTVQVWQPL